MRKFARMSFASRVVVLTSNTAGYAVIVGASSGSTRKNQIVSRRAIASQNLDHKFEAFPQSICNLIQTILQKID